MELSQVEIIDKISSKIRDNNPEEKTKKAIEINELSKIIISLYELEMKCRQQ